MRIKRFIIPSIITLAGLGCNTLVRALNDGYMPAPTGYAVGIRKVYELTGQAQPVHANIWQGTKLVFLADIIPLGSMWLSVGDILMIAGLATYIAVLVNSLFFKNNSHSASAT